MRFRNYTKDFTIRIPEKLCKKINLLRGKVNLSEQLRERLGLIVSRELHNLYAQGELTLDELRTVEE